MKLDFSDFHGTCPGLTARELPFGFAQVARNIDFVGGKLRTFRPTLAAGVVASKTGTIQSLYRYRSGVLDLWLQWLESDVAVVPSLIAGDATGRIVFSGVDFPRVANATSITSGGGTAYPNVSYRLGIPAPDSAPVVSRSGDLPTDAGDLAEYPIEEVAYCYTYKSAWGEESAPSSPSTVIEVAWGFTDGSNNLNAINITGLSTGPSGSYFTAGMTKCIYRAAVGVSDGAWLLVAEIPLANTTYDDDEITANIGPDVLPSADYDTPPADGHGLVTMPNSFLLMLSGNQVCPSEPGQPHAYPVGYRQALDHDGVCVKVVGTTAFILTKGNPYTYTGVHPSSASLEKVDRLWSCMSARGAVDAGTGVIYPTPLGLAYLGYGTPEILTDALQITPEKWVETYNPSSIHAYFWHGKYVAFYTKGSTQAGFVFDPVTRKLTDIDTYATAGYVDLEHDKLYLMVNGVLVVWDGAASGRMTGEWRSGIVELPYPATIGAARVRATSYPVTFSIYADGALYSTETATDGEPFRPLCSNNDLINRDVEIKVPFDGTTTAEVLDISLADTMTRLMEAA